MASAKQVESLLNSHIEGDEEHFLSVALQVAAAEARQGRKESAESLKKLVQRARDRKRPSVGATAAAIPFARPRGELQDLVASSFPDTKLDNMVLPPVVRESLEEVVAEQRQRGLLRDHDERPLSKLLLVGPPGTGKTMTASALAGELNLPLYTIRLDALFTRFLGETAAKLRLVFEQAWSTRGVYFFDEFDALGSRRGDTNDIGEMRRILNSFLQFLEEPNATDSPVVAATNHPEILDFALARRFDAAIAYDLPAPEHVREIIARRVGPLGQTVTEWKPVIDAAAGLSQAEISLAAGQALKKAIMAGTSALDAGRLIEHLCLRRAVRERFNR